MRGQEHLSLEYECEILDVDPAQPATLYRESQTENGYEGRTGIYELIAVDDQMRAMIHDGAGEQALEAYAREQGPGIRQAGIENVLDGTTTLEEVLRVTRSD